MDSTVALSVSLEAVILSPDAAVLEAISDARSSVAELLSHQKVSTSSEL